MKINTTVTQLNFEDDFSKLIQIIQPNRWKVFQIHLIKGQNDGEYSKLSITDSQFQAFIDKNKGLLPPSQIIFENEDDMTKSYFMIDPLGQIMDNSNGALKYWGLDDGLNNIGKIFDFSKFKSRQGIYSLKNLN